ncbi:MAG: family 78 glycoside hydrolase catalytic domain, partial [Phycisphaerae bacterium]|nr:family 78 glycoside hydrolase catalytic domain [Phycisphaerae bacterium]
AKANGPAGPWIKQKDVIPFRTKPNTYYSITASPGQVIRHEDEYLQFFSATTRKPGNPCVQRTLGMARTRDLNGSWTVDPEPVVPIEEQIENSTLYYERTNQTWFLFTNHIGIDQGEYTDAIWVYWSKDLNEWDPQNKAVVLDGENCTWSKTCIGLPSVVQVGKRLALFYDAPGGDSTSHMNRSVALAWLDLPLKVPETDVPVAKKSIKVTDLRCETLTNPLGIDATRPRVSWKLESDTRGQKQTAYRLLVASSRDKLDKNLGDLWDSGRVTSDQSVHVAYHGKTLESRMQCFWKVMVWDKEGRASGWSELARWSMGLLQPDDWSAQWIGVTSPLKTEDVTVTKATYQTLDASVAVDVTDIVKRELAQNKPLIVDFKTFGGDPARGVVKELVVEYSHEGKRGLTRAKDFETLSWAEVPTAPFYRRSFQMDDIPERATMYVAPLGYFELYVNGRKVGDEVLAPAVSNFSKRSYYRTYDVTHYLKTGTNSLGIWMGTGWYSPGLPGVTHDSPVVRAQLELSGAGRTHRIVTDASWQTKPSPRKLLGEWRWGKFGGEQVDARQIDTAWWDTQKSMDGWTSVVEVDVADVPCTAQTCAGNVGFSVVTPTSVERLDKDTILVDFGTNLTGFMNMTFRDLAPGQRVTLHYADLDGRDKDEAWRAKQTHKGFAVYGQFDEFISAGAKEETFKNVFNYHAFQYVLIEGLPYVPDTTDMSAVCVETQVAETGTFTCSNELYNRIHTMVRWTYRCLNLGGQTVDCPHRERLGYGDGQTIMDTGCFNFDTAALYAKWSQNWWDEQQEDGFVPFTAPCPHSTGGGPAWGAMCVMVPWKTYLFYGDQRLLAQGYPFMKKYLAYLEDHCKDGILEDIFPGERWPNLGDWVPPRRGMDKQDWVDDTSRRFFNNCYRIYLLQAVQRIAGILGKADDVKVFEQAIRAAQEKVHATWFNAQDNTYANGEQPYLIFPLKTGVTPEPLRQAVFEKYIETLLETDKGHLNTGMIGTQLMVDTLLEQNRNDLVDTFVNKTTYPGWGYMVEKGATTCWEQWNGYFSQIHSCFPYIGGWFYRGLAGIQWDPETPGFKHVILRPAVVESVDWVKCTYDSPYGRIVSDWTLLDGSFRWDIGVPPNTNATIYMPAKDVKSIQESGVTLQEVDGVTFLRMEEGHAVLQVGSGTYRFSSDYDRGNE